MGSVLVTGASGFIGSVLARHLTRKGLPVLRAVRTVRDDSDVAMDLTQPGDIVIPPGVGAIAHLAQSRVYRDFPGDSGEMFAVNVAGTLALLQAAARAGVRRFCLVSSGTVYEPFDGPLVETAAIQPRSFLGASKAAGEVIARPFGALMDLSILRLFTPYGPGQAGRMIPDLIARVREGRAVTLAGEHGLRFSPTYVDDISSVIFTALTEGWTGTVNVASPETLDLRRAAGIIGEIVGRPPVFEAGKGNLIDLVPVLNALSQRFDLRQFTSFAEGIRRTVEGTIEMRHS